MSQKKAFSRLAATGCILLSVVYSVPAALATAETSTVQKSEIAVALPMSGVPLMGNEESTPADSPIVIDNDEQKLEAEYKWSEIKDGPDKTRITAGARFPVAIQSQLSSKTAKVGDLIEARLQVDIKIGGRLIAPKGAVVFGHVIGVERARKMIAAEFTLNKRFMRMAGCLGIQFDEILTDKGEHIPLVAVPATNARIVKNSADGRVMGVNRNGQIASPLSGQLKSQGIHMAIRVGAAAGGVFSFGIVPAAFACAGAISPSFAFMQPIGKNVRHRRLKGFGVGLIAGLPGGFLVTDSMIRGPEAIIQPGDVFEAEFKQEFNGEASTEANLLPGVRIKVHGELVPKKK
jgi:hypothetical protein